MDRKFIFLSPSRLNLFTNCPRCFWLEINCHRKRPETPTSTLPRGMDLKIKEHFDQYRRAGLPPALAGKLRARLYDDLETLKKWRFWKTGLSFSDAELGAKLTGALDDCLIDSQGRYSPLDYKTYGFELKEEVHPSFILQLDAYTFLLRANNYPVNNYGCLVYYVFKGIASSGQVEFEVVVKPVKTDPERAHQVFREAVNITRMAIPDHNLNCSFCLWAKETALIK